MPELPEVETVKRVLEPQLAGRKILSLTAVRPVVLAHPSAELFCRQVTGAVIRRLSRRGKFLQLHLENGDTLVVHLRMTGQLLVTPSDFPREKHTHVIFLLDDGKELRFIDLRRFGRFWLKRAGEEDSFTGLGRLGIEPSDPLLTAGYLQEQLGSRRKTIKECLLDQNVIAGIGNIYSDEILFACRIHPARKAHTLKKREWVTLAKTIPPLMAFFVEKNSISPEDYLLSGGQDYRNTPFLKVYGHEGDSCTYCGTPLKRMVIGGRSSCYCPKCQSTAKPGQ